MFRGRKVGFVRLTPEDVEKIVLMTKEGFDRPEIAKEVGCSARNVYNWQKKMDL